MGYLCLTCFNEYRGEALKLDNPLYDGYHYRCPDKKCGDINLVEIDDLILPIIKLLNMKGYMTVYCCSSHSYELKQRPNTYISFKKECLPDIVPEGFVLEDEKWCKENRYSNFDSKESICIRKNYNEDLDEYELHQEICKTMITLLDWAEELEDMVIN